MRLLFILMLLLSTNSMAITGNEVLGACEEAIKDMEGKPNNKIDASFCEGVIYGYADAYRILRLISEKNAKFSEVQSYALPCISHKVSSGQLIRVLVKYFKEHPEELHLHYSLATRLALLEAFPCK